jgi:hypothetical protein
MGPWRRPTRGATDRGAGVIDHGAEAERLLADWDMGVPGLDGLAPPDPIAEAQVHATLAVAQRLADLLSLLERGR